MKNTIFKFCRFCVRCFTSHYEVCASNETAAPAVYVVHHQNLRGPVLSMAWFNIPLHPWVLNVFCTQKACFSQYYNYTFTQRFGMTKLAAAVISFPLSFFVSWLMGVIQAIPVYRGSRNIVITFNQSISVLIHGQSLLICPDIDYTDKGENMGEMYNGFLDLEKYYIKQIGKHLAFVPLHISKSNHCIYQGEAIYFNTDEHFKQEKINVYNRLKQEFSRLEEQANR